MWITEKEKIKTRVNCVEQWLNFQRLQVTWCIWLFNTLYHMWPLKKKQIMCSLWPLKLEKGSEYMPCCWLNLTCNDTLKFWGHMYTICCSNFCLFHPIISCNFTISCILLCRPPPPSSPSFISCFLTHILLSTLAFLHFILLLHSCSISSLNCCLIFSFFHPHCAY